MESARNDDAPAVCSTAFTAVPPEPSSPYDPALRSWIISPWLGSEAIVPEDDLRAFIEQFVALRACRDRGAAEAADAPAGAPGGRGRQAARRRASNSHPPARPSRPGDGQIARGSQMTEPLLDALRETARTVAHDAAEAATKKLAAQLARSPERLPPPALRATPHRQGALRAVPRDHPRGAQEVGRQRRGERPGAQGGGRAAQQPDQDPHRPGPLRRVARGVEISRPDEALSSGTSPPCGPRRLRCASP